MTGFRARTLKLAALFFSPVFLVWMTVGWLSSYVVSAVWTNEAFGTFVGELSGSRALKIMCASFLVCGAGNLVRASRARLKTGTLYFLLWVILPAGLLLYGTAFFLSLSSRQAGNMILGEGDPFKPPWSSAEYRVSKINLGMPDKFLDIDFEKGSGIFQYEPRITLQNGLGAESTVGAFPPASYDGTYFHILNFGIAPKVTVKEVGVVISESYAPLRIIVPGTTDNLSIPTVPFRFQIGMEPVRIIEKGSVKAAEFSLHSPRYSIRVYDGEKIIAEKRGVGELQFDRFEVLLGEPAAWVQVEAVRDPWHMLLVAGLLMTAAGALIRLVGGVVTVYRKLFVE